MRKYELQRPYLSCLPGEIEAFMFKLKEGASYSDSDPQLLLVNSMTTQPLNVFEPSEVQRIMDLVMSLNEPSPLDRSVYVRPSGQYYLSAELAGQCVHDLYELAFS